MSLIHADLPSEDEADDDYDPSHDPADGTVEKAKTGTKRRRGNAEWPGTPKGDKSKATTSESLETDTSLSVAKKQEIDQLWAQLNKGKGLANRAKPVIAEPVEQKALHLKQAATAQEPLSLAAICRPVTKKAKAGNDVVRLDNTIRTVWHMVRLQLQQVSQ